MIEASKRVAGIAPVPVIEIETEVEEVRKIEVQMAEEKAFQIEPVKPLATIGDLMELKKIIA